VRLHPEIIELLLEYGANVDARDTGNPTPLYRASRNLNGLLESVRILLRHGADVHIRGVVGWTPFQTATWKSRSEVAQLLLEHGAVGEYVDVADMG